MIGPFSYKHFKNLHVINHNWL